ncbi:hypothetical protein SNEBB_004467 [Seison nebaliae]|nr:hypothetical protein SNEBB_004467 [Seison nebaliae]
MSKSTTSTDEFITIYLLVGFDAISLVEKPKTGDSAYSILPLWFTHLCEKHERKYGNGLTYTSSMATHTWMVYVDTVNKQNKQLKDLVKCVEFVLVPEYDNYIRRITKSPYRIIERGFAGFVVKINLVFYEHLFRDNKKFQISLDCDLALHQSFTKNRRIERILFTKKMLSKEGRKMFMDYGAITDNYAVTRPVNGTHIVPENRPSLQNSEIRTLITSKKEIDDESITVNGSKMQILRNKLLGLKRHIVPSSELISLNPLNVEGRLLKSDNRRVTKNKMSGKKRSSDDKTDEEKKEKKIVQKDTKKNKCDQIGKNLHIISRNRSLSSSSSSSSASSSSSTSSTSSSSSSSSSTSSSSSSSSSENALPTSSKRPPNKNRSHVISRNQKLGETNNGISKQKRKNISKELVQKKKSKNVSGHSRNQIMETNKSSKSMKSKMKTTIKQTGSHQPKEGQVEGINHLKIEERRIQMPNKNTTTTVRIIPPRPVNKIDKSNNNNNNKNNINNNIKSHQNNVSIISNDSKKLNEHLNNIEKKINNNNNNNENFKYVENNENNDNRNNIFTTITMNKRIPSTNNHENDDGDQTMEIIKNQNIKKLLPLHMKSILASTLCRMMKKKMKKPFISLSDIEDCGDDDDKYETISSHQTNRIRNRYSSLICLHSSSVDYYETIDYFTLLSTNSLRYNEEKLSHSLYEIPTACICYCHDKEANRLPSLYTPCYCSHERQQMDVHNTFYYLLKMRKNHFREWKRKHFIHSLYRHQTFSWNFYEKVIDNENFIKFKLIDFPQNPQQITNDNINQFYQMMSHVNKFFLFHKNLQIDHYRFSNEFSCNYLKLFCDNSQQENSHLKERIRKLFNAQYHLSQLKIDDLHRLLEDVLSQNYFVKRVHKFAILKLLKFVRNRLNKRLDTIKQVTFEESNKSKILNETNKLSEFSSQIQSPHNSNDLINIDKIMSGNENVIERRTFSDMVHVSRSLNSLKAIEKEIDIRPNIVYSPKSKKSRLTYTMATNNDSNIITSSNNIIEEEKGKVKNDGTYQLTISNLTDVNMKKSFKIHKTVSPYDSSKIKLSIDNCLHIPIGLINSKAFLIQLVTALFVLSLKISTELAKEIINIIENDDDNNQFIELKDFS